MRLPLFPFVVLDTETTGLLPHVHRVIECAVTRFENGEKVAEYDSLYRIEGEIPPHVQALTHIRPGDLAGKPAFREEAQRLQSLLAGAVVIGHNIPFDLSMIAGEGIELENPSWIDTAMMASLLFPELESWSLSYLSTVLQLSHEPKHRALGDVHATAALLMKEWERLSEFTPALLREVQHIAERGPEGYALLFSSAKAKGKRRPIWLPTKPLPPPPLPPLLLRSGIHLSLYSLFFPRPSRRTSSKISSKHSHRKAMPEHGLQ